MGRVPHVRIDMTSILARLAPLQAGALWIGFLVAFWVFGDHERLVSRRNVALVGLLSVAPFLFDILDVGSTTQAWSLGGVFLVTGMMALWGVRLSQGPQAEWRPSIPVPALRVLTVCMVVLGTSTVLTKPPDDAGRYTNLGAQRWTETGQLPYGDEKLKGPDSPAFGAAATYGPVLYALHIPFQQLLSAQGNSVDADPLSSDYRWPPQLATQLTTWTLFLISVGAFFVVARRLGGTHLAWGMTAVFAASPYFAGLGGEGLVIGGLRFVSHIAPMAMTLLAFMVLKRPFWAGALLAIAAGTLFYPAFFFPVWLGWYFFRREGAGRFALGFVVFGAVLALGVIHFTHAAPGESAVRLFVESTLEHQEGTGPRQYGASQFSFWTHQPGLAAVFQRPLFGDSSLLKLSFILFVGFCGFLTWLAKDRSVAQLAGLTAAAAAAVQLWKTHATGSYVEWYLPFLMIALFTQSVEHGSAADDHGSATEPPELEAPDPRGIPTAG